MNEFKLDNGECAIYIYVCFMRLFVKINSVRQPARPTCMQAIIIFKRIYRKISNIRRTKFPKLNVSRLVLQLSLPNSTEPGVKSRMKTTSEWSTILLSTKVRLILETWRYFHVALVVVYCQIFQRQQLCAVELPTSFIINWLWII